MPRFNDGFYFKSITEWENETVPQRAWTDHIGWFLRLLPVAVVLGTIVGKSDWKTWLLILVALYPAVAILVFLEEVNENIRYVRHLMRVFRVAVARVSDQVAKYENPDKNFTAYDALSSIDREWENPD
jgi:hypothetical protein